MSLLSSNARRRLVPLLLPLSILTLTACQTSSAPSSSKIKELVKDEQIITKDAACLALKPEQTTREAFNQMTQEERDERAGEAAAWLSLCGGA